MVYSCIGWWVFDETILYTENTVMRQLLLSLFLACRVVCMLILLLFIPIFQAKCIPIYFTSKYRDSKKGLCLAIPSLSDSLLLCDCCWIIYISVFCRKFPKKEILAWTRRKWKLPVKIPVRPPSFACARCFRSGHLGHWATQHWIEARLDFHSNG